MDFRALLQEIRNAPGYAGQIVHVHEEPARPSRYAEPRRPPSEPLRRMLASRGIDRLYSHQAEALDLVREGRNVLVVTGTASGKTLCYVVPIIELLLAEPDARVLLLFPTKALCQDQFKAFNECLAAAGLGDIEAGVYDGDTPAATRRTLRDKAAVLFTNPDMLHAAIMPQHARWAEFLGGLRLLVLDEVHVYSGIFGSNMAGLMRRLRRVCRHYGSAPRIIASSATIANPKELAEQLTDREIALVGNDGSPRGRRTTVFWNPPRIRGGDWRSRRSANVEAHELMALLLRRGVPTITFSKAKMTAEMIYRYVCETLQKSDPALAKRVTPYRGGYLPAERREIERRLFGGELLGVSTTRALELGIDVGGLDAGILVGYPGTLASFFQQGGRAGRRDRESLVVLVAIDTSINQYIVSHPDYLFGRPIEQAVIDPENPFVVLGQVRCAVHELPLGDGEVATFGPWTELVLNVLQDNLKVRRIDGAWYHAASEVPQHEISLRDRSDANVLIEDVDSGAVLGEVDKFDAPPILHPQAIYMHQGDTYVVLDLDLERNIARVKRVEVDYYTQSLGGTDIHHVDARLREKPFGAGAACWGEVTAYFGTHGFEKIHFYSLDAISRHDLHLPTFSLETMAFWLVAPEPLMERVRAAGLDAHSGLRAIGYATRMILPLFITCDTLDFSHTVGSVNSPWNAVFIYERYPHGLGFTEKAYNRLHEIMPAVLDTIRKCPCDDGCPCCVGKPLRQYTTWNIERGEASIPSKKAALMILEGMLGDGAALHEPDAFALSDSDEAEAQRLERALRRRLERMREPRVFHPIEPKIQTAYPDSEAPETLSEADVARRAERRRDFQKDLRKRLAKKLQSDKLAPLSRRPALPAGMKSKTSNLRPTDFPGRPAAGNETSRPPAAPPEDNAAPPPVAPRAQGDPLAARARKMRKKGGG